MTTEFRIDTTVPGTPFPHYWELCVGSCHAIMGLRQDWRNQLEKSHHELGFQYVRFHGLLNDEMSVVKKDSAGSVRYSFFNIDSIFDFLLSIGMKPFVELSFMPEELASSTATCFHYRANTTPPSDYEEWAALIKALTQHLVERYGLPEVRSWFFEVWNEPNLKFFWAGTQEDYFRLYEVTAQAIKSVNRKLKVGGPATSVNAWIPDFLDFCHKNSVPVDFVSTHHYPTDDPLWKNALLTMEEYEEQFGNNLPTYERGVLYKMTARARSEAGNMPLYYTEWNTSAMVPDVLHDEPYSAALVLKTIVDNDGLVDGYSFWTFTDLFEEGGQYSAPFHGGFGLQNIHGIPKPTYRVFELLHKLGFERLHVAGGKGCTAELLAVRSDRSLTLLAYNHNIPAAAIHTEEVRITVNGLNVIESASISRIDAQNAHPKQKWLDLGRPEYPDRQEISQMMQASEMRFEKINVESTSAGGIIHFTIPPHGIVVINLTA